MALPSFSLKRSENIEAAFVSKYWEFIYTDEAVRPTTLINAFSKELPHIAPDSWSERFKWGGIFVNGIEAKGDLSLPFPCRLEYYEPRFDFTDPYSYFPKFSADWIVYEDADLIGVFKPEKLPSMPAREQKHFCLKSYVENHLGQKVHMPSRLDMSTTGLVLMSKSPDLHDRLQRIFEKRRIEKFYLLETAASVDFSTLTVDSSIGKDPDHPVLRKPVTEGGKPATTEFTVLGHSHVGTSPTTLIEARPRTGRTHQIRVHAFYSGFPIVGDKFYEGIDAPCLHLLSYKAILPHPRSGERIEIVVPKRLLPEWALAVL